MLIENLLSIKDKRGVIVPFKFNASQEHYWKHRTRRNLVLKPRQKGLSKIIDADQLIECIRKPTNAVIISHEKTATQRLFKSVRSFLDLMPPDAKPATSIDSKTEIQFPKRGSSYFIGTAGQKAFGRGDTVDRAHLSEAAFYENLERILGGIAEAAEYGQIDIETTANGRGEFYDLWQKAKAGQSSYTPIFIPWFIDQEYSSDNLTEEERQGLSVGVREMIAVPDAEFIAALNPEEKALVARVAEEWNIILTAGQLKWRRYKIWDKGLLFFQEYPEDDVSCFLQSGRSVFSLITCDPTKKIDLDDFEGWCERHGWDDEQREAFMKHTLYGGVDCAEGTPTGDAHCFTVIDAPADSPRGTVIYELTSNDPIDVFDAKVDRICQRFSIMLGVEKNGVGVAHVNKFRELETTFEEWETTAANRPVMISDLEEAYRKDLLVETYREAENECRDMEYNKSNKPEAKSGKHDDRVMSRAIAWQMRNRPKAGIDWL